MAIGSPSVVGEMHIRSGRYIGVAPVPGGLPNVCLVRPSRPADPALADPSALLARELARDVLLCDRAAGARLVAPPVVLGPLAIDVAPAAIDGLLLAGDAAGFIDPMTGDGLRFAIRGGELAAGAALDALANRWAGGHGLLTGGEQANQRLAALAEQTLGCLRAFPAPSGTHALELMMRALPLEPGGEVILPSFTFVSAANAVILAGGRPVLADIDPDTLNLDPADAAARVTPRTRPVLTAHYAGIAAGLDALASLAARTRIAPLEDAAHALAGRFRPRALGTCGRAGTFSFHGT